MSEKIPFFINSNILTSQDDIKNFSSLMESISYNIGNSYITYSLIKECFDDIKTLHHIQNIYTYDFEDSYKDIDFINNIATHVIFILQDQIRLEESYGLKLPYEKIKNFIKRINKPIIIAGLGANYFTSYDKNFYKELSPELVDFLCFLSEHCIKIGIRGYFTQEILSNLGIKNTQVIGCPSYFETGKNRIITKQKLEDFEDIILTSRFHIKGLENNFQIMQDLSEAKFIKAICYNDFEMFYTDEEMYKLKNHQYRFFSNIDDWKNYIKQFKFAIGNRLHGTILAINSGIPAICCNRDARATEMCAFLGIPHYKDISEDINIMDLYEKLDIISMNKNYKYLYQNFEDFLRINNLEIIDELKPNDINKFPIIELYKKGYTIKCVKTVLFVTIRKRYNEIKVFIRNKYKIFVNYLKIIIKVIINRIKAVLRILKFKMKTFL